MSIYDLIHDLPQGEDHSGDVRSITPKQFLGIEGDAGFSNPSELLAYCKSLRLSEVKHLEQFFNCIKSELRITNYSVSSTDKGGRPYTFISFNRPKGTLGLKLIMEAGMDSFFISYLNGEVTINFSLEQLIEEAKQH